MISTVILEMPSSIPHKSVWAYRSQMSSLGWRLEKFPLESHAVGIMGIWVHDPVHVDSRLLSAGNSFHKVSGFLLDGHVNGFINHLTIAL